ARSRSVRGRGERGAGEAPRARGGGGGGRAVPPVPAPRRPRSVGRQEREGERRAHDEVRAAARPLAARARRHGLARRRPAAQPDRDAGPAGRCGGGARGLLQPGPDAAARAGDGHGAQVRPPGQRRPARPRPRGPRGRGDGGAPSAERRMTNGERRATVLSTRTSVRLLVARHSRLVIPMSWWEAIVLGLVQGLAEFLPVSSSGHLVLGQYFLGIDEPSITFEVFAHFGTVLSIVTVYWQRILAIL